MTPLQLLTQIKNGTLAPLYLFTGPEMYRRRVCRKQMVEKFLPEELREEGYVRFDLDEVSVRDVIDDASSFSLFTPKRLLWVSGAEGAIPRGGTINDDDPGVAALAAYAKNPTPDVIVVFDCHRFSFDGDDKTKMERLRKYYAAIPNVVEFTMYSDDEARKLAADLAKRSGLNIPPAVLESLVESLGADATRLANEIEKLALFTGGKRAVTEEDIASLTPDARATTIFALVNALGRRDRAGSLDLLETLVRDGEYLPLALTFLATQFRFALIAKEEGLKTTQQLQAHCARIGVGMWPSRAQQVFTTVNAFSRKQIEQALTGLYRADRDLRDRPADERIVIETLVFSLTR
ncbi:MAG: DNA polymerase III subunit delta [Acidobacteria bacterium]|nr:DNA polymerase III subunit delta [Acidobacteriota bacterium]